jgi:hypothetical protein
VLLPSDTHRKPITSIRAVLHPFVTYLLTLPRQTSDLVTDVEAKKLEIRMDRTRMNKTKGKPEGTTAGRP